MMLTAVRSRTRMIGLKEGDWARTDMGREGTVVVMSADGMRAYIERDQTSI
jgi:hypothetical protein